MDYEVNRSGFEELKEVMNDIGFFFLGIYKIYFMKRFIEFC